jgi:hypothetical protein
VSVVGTDLPVAGPGPHPHRERDGSVLVPALGDFERHDMEPGSDDARLVHAAVHPKVAARDGGVVLPVQRLPAASARSPNDRPIRHERTVQSATKIGAAEDGGVEESYGGQPGEPARGAPARSVFPPYS